MLERVLLSSSTAVARRLFSRSASLRCAAAASAGCSSDAGESPAAGRRAERRHASSSAESSSSWSAPPVPMMRRLRNLLAEGVGAEEVGSDGKNVFFRRSETDADGMPVEKRWMRYTSGLYYPEEVPAEWHSWLNFLRTDPPTADEILENDRRRRDTKMRAKALERNELQRQLNASSIARDAADGDDAYSEATKSALVHRLRATASDEAPQREKAERASDHGTTGGASFQPDAWRPGRK